MNEIKVAKSQLLEALRTNRDGHAAQYEKAKAGYLKVTKAKLDGLIERVAAGEVIGQQWIDPAPEDHTKDYDVIISMMEWSIGDEVVLSQAQFRQYVQDDWGWREQWMTSNSVYVEAAR